MHSTNQPPREHTAAVSSKRVVAAASFGFALVQLDVTIINVALPRIAHALHTDVTGLQWLVDAYALTFSVLLLSSGALADRIGAKRIYLAGLAGFALSSLACGLAPSAPLLIAARTLQGVAAAAMLPSSLALINHATAHDPRLRARAVGVWTAAGAVTIAAGPIVSGFLLALSTWRSIFFVNLPLCAIGAWLSSKLYDDHDVRAAKSFDLAGQALAIVALGSLTAAVIEARPLGVAHPLVRCGFGLAMIAGAAFVVVEAKSRTPMLPLTLFRSASFSTAVVYGIVANATYYGAVFVLTLYLQRVRGYSPLQAGFAYLPLTATLFFANISSGWLVGKLRSRWPMVCGALVNACGFWLLSQLTAASSYWQMLPAFLLIPLGLGTGVPAMTTAVLASVERARAGSAAGVLNAARQAAGAMGVAVFGALVGDDPQQMVSGLGLSATLCCALLLSAAAVAWRGMRPATA